MYTAQVSLSMPKILTATPFSLETSQGLLRAEIIMRLHISQVTTRDFPRTAQMLEKLLPTIFAHRCLNVGELPFSQEVLATELGHLFEHITMEYLHQFTNNKIRGETVWDWNKEPRGTFHIYLDSPKSDAVLLSRAVSSASKLMTDILANSLDLAGYSAPAKSPGDPQNNN